MATVDLTEQAFAETVRNHDVVLVDFWASWCGPCRMFAPTYEAVSRRHEEVVFAKVDAELARRQTAPRS